MSLPAARPAVPPSSALARAFGGAPPITHSPAKPAERSSFMAVPKEVGLSVTGHTLGFGAHGLSAVLDNSAMGVWLKQNWRVAPSTLGLVLATGVAMFVPRKGRRAAITAVIGFLHAKLHDPASRVPDFLSSLRKG